MSFTRTYSPTGGLSPDEPATCRSLLIFAAFARSALTAIMSTSKETIITRFAAMSAFRNCPSADFSSSSTLHFAS